MRCDKLSHLPQLPFKPKGYYTLLCNNFLFNIRYFDILCFFFFRQLNHIFHICIYIECFINILSPWVAHIYLSTLNFSCSCLAENDIKEGVLEKSKLVLKYSKWSLDIHTVVHFSIFNFKFLTWINRLCSQNTRMWALS